MFYEYKDDSDMLLPSIKMQSMYYCGKINLYYPTRVLTYILSVLSNISWVRSTPLDITNH